MSPFPPLLKSSSVARRAGRDSFALIATLALLAVATLLLVLFVTATSSDRSASYTYSQSLKADQIARGGLHMIVGQLQAEMYKDGMPDTNGGAYPAIFTNVASFNLLPQATVTNSFLPTMVKMSTNSIFFTGTNSIVPADAKGQLKSTTISSTTPSLNGRSVSTNIWNEVYLGQFPNNASAPYWLLISRSGATNAAGIGFGTSGTTVNNPAVTPNPNYVIGRVAFAVYDEGGLLDATAAGCPTSISSSATQLAQIKGTLAGADLTQLGIDPVAFTNWRNAASKSSYLSFVTNFASTNGFLQVYPGDSTFLSRQDLIKAAQNNVAGFSSTNALMNLTTFTRELNAPSWAPSLNGAGTSKYNYATNAKILTSSPFSASTGKQNPNPYIPLVRHATSGTVTGYLANGLPYYYQVNIGDPLVQHRFPLDRLNWVTPTGPAAGISAAAIQACFGLVWAPAENLGNGGDTNWKNTVTNQNIPLWKYVGPSGNTETMVSSGTASPVETLSDVAKEAPREPNFFELLQAGILSGSLGQSLGGANTFQNINNTAQTFSSVQLLRIGASIISQAQNSAYPINIESNQIGYSMVSSGVANLPYLNVLKFVSGADGYTTGTTSTSIIPMATYGLIGLWNPHQQSTTTQVKRPNVRLYVQGSIAVGSGWCLGTGDNYPAIPVTTSTYGSTFTILPNTSYVQLVNNPGVVAGVNGFLNPFAITSSDVAYVTPTGSSATLGFTSSTSALTYESSGPPPYQDVSALNGALYEALRIPNVNVQLSQMGNNIPGGTGDPEDTSLGQVHFSYYLCGTGGNAFPATSASLFQLILKYQDPNDASGTTWVPYDYWTGNSNWQTWCGPFGLSGPTIAPNTLPLSGSGASMTTKAPYLIATVDQTMHSTGPNGARFHSGTLFNPAPLAMRPGIFPMSGDHSHNTNTGDVVYPLIDSIWSGNANAGDFSVAGYGGAGSNNNPGPAGIPSELNSVPTDFVSWFYPAFLCRNNTTYPNAAGAGPGSYFTAYPDPDGVQRIGDSGLFPTPAAVSAPANTGNPYYDPNDLANTSGQRTGDRPIVLNRPFASVGELGYVDRDDPWRTLDFFSVFKGVSTSADSGLLDLFTVTDSPNPVIAGRVNLNTKNQLVLQAILKSTMADVLGNTSSSTQISDPTDLATALIAYTSTTSQALVNKDQLVTKFNPSLPTGSAANSPFGSTDEQNVKFCREAFVRSLADVGQTRTWNLLIDIVAQAGKYPTTATSLDQFNVEGQRHYWLHVAIDRITGKVIDQQLELVEP
jgi:hypothetical protein